MTSTPSELKILNKLTKSTLSEPTNINYKNKLKKILYQYTQCTYLKINTLLAKIEKREKTGIELYRTP